MKRVWAAITNLGQSRVTSGNTRNSQADTTRDAEPNPTTVTTNQKQNGTFTRNETKARKNSYPINLVNLTPRQTYLYQTPSKGHNKQLEKKINTKWDMC